MGAGVTERAAYRIKEFAEAVGIDRVTVWRWIKRGQIPTIRIGALTLIPAHILAHIQDGHSGRRGATRGNTDLQKAPGAKGETQPLATRGNV